MIYVAKSYQGLTQLGDVFALNGKQYIKVQMKNGSEKTVRVYSEKEYKKMYPEAKVETKSEYGGQKHGLGFDNGYITIFKGDTYPHLDWFKLKRECRYATFWGWYVTSREEVPADLPEGITPIKLYWENVGEGESLKAESIVKTHVESLLYDAGTSEWQGNIKERIEIEVDIKRNIQLDSLYGTSNLHIMEDAEGNLYSWTTTTQSWPEGSHKRIKGTVSAHDIYKNQKQTKLTRCAELN